MKSQFLRTKSIAILAIAVFTFASGHAQTKPIKVLQNADTLITRNTTWDADTIYFLGGKVYVTNGAELTIQPGTVIVGDTTRKGTLLITKGSKIHATGTPSCPIIFTSAKAPGRRARGDWGGVILLGKSATNNPGGIQYIEGLPPSSLTEFGGGTTPDLHDNSGEMKYVRIEFPGYALSPNNEINGLTFGAVGDGTQIEYVQVSYSNDDSYEWFGGTVNCKHLIAFRGIDDDFDTDNGFSGKLQFGMGLRDPLVADVSGSNGFESDNNATGTTDLPQTRAVFSNFTLTAGSDSATNSLFRNAAHIRRNSHIYVYNSILMGWPNGILIDGTTTQSNVLADTLVKFDIIGEKYAPKDVTTTPLPDPGVVNLLLSHANNRFYTGNASVGLKNPYKLNKPNYRPIAGSPALTGANFNEVPLQNSFFTPTSYVGAFAKQSSQDWTILWTNFVPTSTDYSQVNAACSTAPLASAVAAENAIDNKAIVANPVATVYPNPAKGGSFKVDLEGFSGNVTIKISNMAGTMVYNKVVNAGLSKTTVDVNLAKAPAGLYFVTVTNGKQTTTQKVNVIQ